MRRYLMDRVHLPVSRPRPSLARFSLLGAAVLAGLCIAFVPESCDDSGIERDDAVRREPTGPDGGSTLPRAERPADPPEIPEVGVGLVAGIVQGEDSLPIPNAEVYAVAPSTDVVSESSVRIVRTQQDGSFELDQVTVGATVDIIVRKRGYLSSATEVLLSRSDPQQTIVATLLRGASISGRVTDLDGNPIQGAQVLARSTGADPNRVRAGARLGRVGIEAARFGIAETGEDGSYRISGLYTGLDAYVVAARKMGYVPDFSGHERSGIEPGSTGVDLRLEAIWGLDLTFVDSRSGVRVPSVRLESVARGLNVVGSGLTREWLDKGPTDAERRLTGEIRILSKVADSVVAGESKASLTLYVSAPGYETTKWIGCPSPIAADGITSETIAMTPIVDAFGRLTLDLVRATDGERVLDGWMPLRLTFPGSESYTSIEKIVDGAVVFQHIPVGSLTLEPYDGSDVVVPRGEGRFEATNIDVSGDTRTTIEVDRWPGRARVYLTVIDSEGSSVRYSNVTITGEGWMTLHRGRSQAFGHLSRHVFSVPPGSSKISVTKPGFLAWEYTAQFDAGRDYPITVLLERRGR